jgi:hypothetical protein
MNQNLPQTSADLRVTLVQTVVPTVGAGPSLQEIDSATLPDGALAFVVGGNRWYRLKKTSAVAADTTSTLHNVVPAANGGNWVASIQMAQVVLVGGAATLNNEFDLTGGGYFIVSGLSTLGTPGFRVANKASSTSVSVTSSSGSDTSSVLVQYLEVSAA